MNLSVETRLAASKAARTSVGKYTGQSPVTTHATADAILVHQEIPGKVLVHCGCRMGVDCERRAQETQESTGRHGACRDLIGGLLADVCWSPLAVQFGKKLFFVQ